MCGFVDTKEMAGSGCGDGENGDGGGHASQEQYRWEVNRVADLQPLEEEVGITEGEVGQSEEYNRPDDQGDGVWEAGEGFDTNLTSMHTYLGGLGEVDGSNLLSGAGGALLKLPMFYLEGIVLFPDQKLPLRVLQPRFKAAVSHAMKPEGNDAPYTLGVIHVRVSRNGVVHVAKFGTTAEIHQLRDQSDGSVNVMTKGRQRFRIWRVWTAHDGALFAEVQIIAEDTDTIKHVPRAAFGAMASVHSWRSGRSKRAPNTASGTGLSYGSPSATIKEEFHVDVESTEHENQFVGDEREVHLANEGDSVVDDESEDEDPEEVEERTEDLDREESEDLYAAVTGVHDEHSSDDDEEDDDDESFERPHIRQRLDTATSAVSAIARRVEEIHPVGRDSTEGRNRERGPFFGKISAIPPSEPQLGDVVEGKNNGEESAEQNVAPIVAVVSAETCSIEQKGAWMNSFKQWRQDAALWSRRAQLSAWPHWVYRQYDCYNLARRAADMLRQMGDHPKLDDLLMSPTAVSYYIASNMAIQDHTRQELLDIDSTLARLKREIQLLEGMDTLKCNSCLEVVARLSDTLVMSYDGAIGAYVNAHGYVHETLTLASARGMRIVGQPQTENSWFPGYAWVLAKCQKCYTENHEQHMGWRFTAVDSATRPRSFWGIRRTQLIGSSEAPPPDDSEAEL